VIEPMHGSHHLDEEYKISASRLESHRASFEASRGFFRSSSGLPSESSSASKSARFKSYLKRICVAILTTLLITLGLVRSIGPQNIIKSCAFLAVFSLSLPKTWIVKRNDPLVNQPKLLEISSPLPYDLVIALNDNLYNVSSVLSNVPSSSPFIIATTSTNVSGRHLLNDSTSVFESIAFSWCQSYQIHKRYPRKLIIAGPSNIAACALGSHRWAMKIPQSKISFHATSLNSSSPLYNSTFCSNDHRSDPFDCTENNARRMDIRHKYSQLCPDLSPILLACSGKAAMNRAIAYIPPWYNV
jgi:hypothetical protein